MIANLTALLPLISVVSVLLVSVNTIGYFVRIGPHFLGLMDLTNFIYPLGLAFGGLIIALQLLAIAYGLLARWRNVAEFDPTTTLGASLVVLVLGSILAVLLVRSHNVFYGFLAFIAIGIAFAATLGFASFLKFHLNRRKIDSIMILATVGCISGTLLADYAAGAAQADYQAFRTPTLYKITDKHGFDTVVRIIRASSSGLLVASLDRRVIFVPKEEYRQVEREKPISY